MVEKIRKRDGSVVNFEKEKIAKAIWKAAQAVGGKDEHKAEDLANEVLRAVERRSLTKD